MDGMVLSHFACKLINSVNLQITKLCEELENINQEEQQIDYELDFILNQQNEFNTMLDQLEKSAAAEEIFDSYASTTYPHHADIQRGKM